MLGAAARLTGPPWFWTDQYDLGVQMVGLHDPARPPLRRDLPEGGFLLFECDASGALVAASGIAPGNGVARDIRLAEMLITRGIRPDPEMLTDPNRPLKALLRA